MSNLVQSKIFSNVVEEKKALDLIPGMKIITNFISKAEHDQLMNFIDNKAEWSNKLKRRTQHYGFEYDYDDFSSPPKPTTPIPEIFQNIVIQKLKLQNIPDQCIVNEYIPPQGIGKHTDHVKHFEDGIYSLSLISCYPMEFFNETTKETKTFTLPVNSLLILTGESRYKWKHSIKACKTDVLDGKQVKRMRRVSITLRKVVNK